MINRQSSEYGHEIPYQQENKEGGTNIAFKKAVLKLIVTPRILPHNGSLLLSIVGNQDKVSSLTGGGVPAIQTQHLSTECVCYETVRQWFWVVYMKIMMHIKPDLYHCYLTYLF